MRTRRVALIFDNEARPETTGTYCLRALKELCPVVHFLPRDLETIPRHGFDLYLQIDDGLRYQLPVNLHPSAFWAIDTHMDFAWCLGKSHEFDFVFAAQKDGAMQLCDEGISAPWLPLACDPDLHCKHEVSKQQDVCFVGKVFDGPRAELLRLIQERYPQSFVGQRYFKELAQTYSASRIVFNRSVRNDVNMRVFEAVACGSLLLTNDLRDNGLEDLFQDGVHLASYTGAEDLLDQLTFYLAHEDVRERIAEAGRTEALARHTYRHRMEQLLRDVDNFPARTVIAVPPSVKPPIPADSPLVVAAREDPPARKATAPAMSPTNENGADLSYYEFARPEIVALVPTTARKVLDVGCGAGRLGEAIKAHQDAEIVGIELTEAAAKAARGRLDRVLVGNVETMDLPFPPGSFDTIICGDVLEHLAQPERFLGRARTWLRPGGCLIASIANVRHHSVIRSLLDGNWTYETAGLLDRTHVRFFTRRAIEDLFHMAGFLVRDWGVIPGPGDDDWQQHGWPTEVSVGRLHLGGLPAEETQEFFGYQYLLTAEPARPTEPPPADWAPALAPVLTPPDHILSAEPTSSTGRRGPMRFTQDFIGDFDQVDFFGAPFAFARFADGERAICMGQPIDVSRDRWSYPGGPSRFADDLNAALRYSTPDYYVGISDGCCDRPARDWYLQQLRIPREQVTFSNLFVNWNYRRFRQLDLQDAVVVSSRGGDFTVPEDCFAAGFDADVLVEKLLPVDRTILVAAGPASAIIIHKYWQRATRKQTIVDVGSALDERTKGVRTRAYQHPGSRTAELVCRW